jgi:hypothetical protein
MRKHATNAQKVEVLTYLEYVFIKNTTVMLGRITSTKVIISIKY